MTDKHTPGPWRIDPADPHHVIAADDGDWSDFWSVSTATDDCGPGMSRTIANARLIAAAPDLLAALDDIVNGENWRSGRKFDPNSGDFDLSIQRAAIAKARGQV